MNRCPTCHSELPPDAPAGVCPKCLVQAGFTSEPSPTAASPGAGFVAPTPAELAMYFPQLEILELLGRGGMGAVYKARQPELDRIVALKILPREAGRDPAFADRFAREARALAKLSHPNIVGIYDSGKTHDLYYFVMEYVDGVNLRQTMLDGGVSTEQAIAIIPQICDALQYAHDQGIVHRDVKPENILLDKKGRVKIADFGLSKLLGPNEPEHVLTATHQVMGTLRYMAPEQMEGTRSVDHRADIYSLGVVFYELLTGEVPMGRFDPPSHKVQVDVRLDEVVLRSLAREPLKRYQHASDVKSDVESIRSSPRLAKPAPDADIAHPTTAGSFWTKPQSGFAAWVGVPVLAMLGIWTLSMIAAQLAWGRKDHYQGEPILITMILGIFGLPLLFLVLTAVWAMLRKPRPVAAPQVGQSPPPASNGWVIGLVVGVILLVMACPLGIVALAVAFYWAVPMRSIDAQPQATIEAEPVPTFSEPLRSAAPEQGNLAVYLEGHTLPVKDLAVTNDGGAVISVGLDGRMIRFELGSGGVRHLLGPNASDETRDIGGMLDSIAISSDGQHAYASGNTRMVRTPKPNQPGKVAGWTLGPPEPRSIFKIELKKGDFEPIPYDSRSTVRGLVPLPDDKLACVVGDAKFVILDRDGKEVTSTPIYPGKLFGNVQSFARSPDGKHVAVTSSNMVPDGDGMKSTEPTELTMFNDQGEAVVTWKFDDYADFSFARAAFLDDRTLALALPSGKLLRWQFDVATKEWKLLEPIKLAPGRYLAAARGLDGKSLWLAHDRQIVRLHAETGKLQAWTNVDSGIRRGTYAAQPIEVIAPIPGGNKIAAGLWDGRIAVLDTNAEAE